MAPPFVPTAWSAPPIRTSSPALAGSATCAGCTASSCTQRPCASTGASPCALCLPWHLPSCPLAWPPFRTSSPALALAHCNPVLALASSCCFRPFLLPSSFWVFWRPGELWRSGELRRPWELWLLVLYPTVQHLLWQACLPHCRFFTPVEQQTSRPASSSSQQQQPKAAPSSNQQPAAPSSNQQTS